jgi:hypothetical protein
VPRHLVVSSYVDIGSCPVLVQQICIHDYLCYPRENSDNLCSLISEATNKGYSHMLIMGDFNYPDID